MPTTTAPQSGKTDNSSSFLSTLQDLPGAGYRYIDSAISSGKGFISGAFETYYQTCNIVIQGGTWLLDGLGAGDKLPISTTRAIPIFIVATFAYKSLELLPNPQSTLGSVYKGIAKLTNSATSLEVCRIINHAADVYFFQFDVLHRALLVNLLPIPAVGFYLTVGTTIYAAIKNYKEKQEENTAQSQSIDVLEQIGKTLFTASALTSRLQAVDRAFASAWSPSPKIIGIAALGILGYAIGQQVNTVVKDTVKKDSSVKDIAKKDSSDKAPSSSLTNSQEANADTKLSTAAATTTAKVEKEIGYLNSAIGIVAKSAHALFNQVESIRKQYTVVEKGIVITNRVGRIIVYGEVIAMPMLELFAPEEAKYYAYLALGLSGLLYGIGEAQATVTTKKKKVE